MFQQHLNKPKLLETQKLEQVVLQLIIPFGRDKELKYSGAHILRAYTPAYRGTG